MNLSTLYTKVPDYLEFGWVTAPNTAGQAVAANTITTLTLNTEVVDLGGHATLDSGTSTISLNSGTYYYEAITTYFLSGAASGTLGLYNGSNLVSAVAALPYNYAGSAGGGQPRLNGGLTLTTTGSLTLRLLTSEAVTVRNGYDNFTLDTAGADQRTTIKLWKLK